MPPRRMPNKGVPLNTKNLSEAELRKQKPNLFKPLLKEEDVLDEDPQLPNQSWGCFSFVTGKDDKNSLCGFKSRGNFGTREEAQNYANFLRDRNNTYHVFVGQVGYWLPFNPDPEQCTDQVYLERGLNDIMTGYLKKQSADSVKFEERKTSLMEKAIYEGTSEGQGELDVKEETVESVKFRHDGVAAKIAEYKEQLELIPKRLVELEEQLVIDKTKLEVAVKRREIEVAMQKENEDRLKARLAELTTASISSESDAPNVSNVSAVINRLFGESSTHSSEN